MFMLNIIFSLLLMILVGLYFVESNRVEFNKMILYLVFTIITANILISLKGDAYIIHVPLLIIVLLKSINVAIKESNKHRENKKILRKIKRILRRNKIRFENKNCIVLIENNTCYIYLIYNLDNKIRYNIEKELSKKYKVCIHDAIE